MSICRKWAQDCGRGLEQKKLWLSHYNPRKMLKVSRVCLSSKVRSLSTKAKSGNVVLVDGVRIPFTMAGSTYGDYLAVDLGRMALKGLLTKTALDPSVIDYMFMGTVIQETRTSNIAREAGQYYARSKRLGQRWAGPHHHRHRHRLLLLRHRHRHLRELPR